MTELFYQIETEVDSCEVADVYRRSGISRPVDDLARLAHMLDHANLLISARDKDHLIGFARALTDFSYCCYVSDLAVDRNYQRQGIGKHLLRIMQDKLGDEVMICLLSAPEAMSYYPHIGFQKAAQAWWLPRKR